MIDNLNPGTLEKKKGKRYEAMVLIATADARLRQKWALGLQDAFASHGVSERSELERNMTDSKPAVLLLDSDLPRLDRFKDIPAIRRLSPSTKVIVLSSTDNEKEVISALKAGAKGYCKKEIEPILLRKAVKVVQSGEIWVGRKIIPRLFAELASLTKSHQKDCPDLPEVYLNYLTPREQQITLSIGKGACNKEIAKQLDISERTVKAHLTAIFQKLQIPDRLRLGLFVNGYNPQTIISPRSTTNQVQ
jgi:DNA-binding NarL/FixJ family response regulator